jgi:hypothetical protein
LEEEIRKLNSRKTTGFDELGVELFMMWKMVCETAFCITNEITNTKVVVASITGACFQNDGYE